MADLPFMPVWINDYEGETAHLNLEEDGALSRLLRLCWRTPGCTLPDDERWLMRHLRCDAELFARAVAPVLTEFFVRESGRIFNARLLEEFERASELHRARVEAGRRGAEAKGLKRNETGSSKAEAELELSDAEAELEPSDAEDGCADEAKTYVIENQRNQGKQSLSIHNQTHNHNQTQSERVVRHPPAVAQVRDATLIPPEWSPTPEDVGYATDAGYTVEQLEPIIRKFRNHHTARATSSADWGATWRIWMDDEPKFNKPPARSASYVYTPGRDFL